MTQKSYFILLCFLLSILNFTVLKGEQLQMGAAISNLSLITEAGKISAAKTTNWLYDYGTFPLRKHPKSSFKNASNSFSTIFCEISYEFAVKLPSCPGERDGSITFVITEGKAPFQVSYDGPTSNVFETSKTKFTIPGLLSGNYKILIEGSGGCASLINVTIGVPPMLDFNVKVTNTCIGGSTGTITVSDFINGDGPYDVGWNGPGSYDGTKIGVVSSYTITNLIAGNYQVGLTDSNGCTTIKNVIVKSSGSLSVSIVGDLTFCNGQNNTNLSTLPNTFVSYLWSNGTTGSSTSVSASGTYHVTVSDANGCTGTASATVTKLPPIVVKLNNAQSQLAESCPGSCDGRIFIDVSGGLESKGYTYNWEGSGGYSSNSEDISSLCNGTYKVTVTDEEGCIAIFEADIAKASSMTFSLVSNSTSCSSTNDGSIETTFNGGASPYSISWSGGESGSNPSVSTGYTITNLNPGNYSVTLTDGNGCDLVRNTVVGQPAAFSFSAAEFSPTCQGSNTGSIMVSNIVNGTGPYNIYWEDLHGNSHSTNTGSTNYTISNLISGTYIIIVTDDNGCEHVVKDVVVSEKSQINVSIIGDLIFCADQTTGVLSTNPPDFGFKWSTGETSKTITISSPGSYSVTVTDAGGCTGVDQVTVSVASDISLKTNIPGSTLSVTCSGNCDGKITPDVSGGVGAPYTYDWTGPGGFSSSSKNISALCPGNYTLKVTDGNGCTKTYTQAIASTSNMEIDLSPTSASCVGMEDGSILSKVVGGNAPFTFLWSNGATSENIFDLAGGTYNVTVTDSKNCSVIGSAVVGEGSSLNGTVSPSSASICKGGEVTLKASGGSEYLWSTGEVTSSIEVSPLVNTTYNVTISGAGGSCSVFKSVSVSVNDLSGAEIQISETSGLVNNDGEICEGNSVNLTATGGVSYMWSGGLSNPLIVSPSSDQTYTVTITNNIGCTAVLSQNIVVNKKPKAIIDISGANQSLGESQVFKNISTSNCGSLLSCKWQVDGNSKSNDCADISHTFNEEGNYIVSLEVENDCGCTDNTMKNIDIYEGDDCKIKSFSINDNVSEVCVNMAVPVEIETEPGVGCNVLVNKVTASINGVEVNSFIFINGTISFFETGFYDLEYTFADDCSCERVTKRQINVVESPDVSFADDNFTTGCVGQSIAIKFDDFDFGDKITIEFRGNTITYETDIIDLFLSETGSFPLRITRVSNATCSNEVSDQIITINVIEPLEIVSRSFTCDDSGLYTLTMETTGGNSASPIISSIPGVQNGDNFVISGLNPNTDFSFTMSRGEFCDPLNVYQPFVSCDCLFDPGSLEETYFLGCSGEYFDITEVYSGSDAPNSLLDTAVYVLHDGVVEATLGKVYEIYPITQAFITNDFNNYIPNKNYILSVVGIRKFDFANLDVNDVTVFDFKGSGQCFSVSNGIPVIWHGSNVSISGPSEVCGNAFNEIFVSAGIGDGAELKIKIPGLTQENYTFNEADGKLYVHFVNGSETEVPIEIIATTYHADVIYDNLYETTCVSDVRYSVNIDQANKSPDTSRVILWPGAIFASTDTLENICYRWGKTTRITNSIVRDTFFEGADERFYFADENDAEGLSEHKQIWVETYFCDDPVCATRNIFNGQFPVNFNDGLSSIGTAIFPNPGSGIFNLKMNNSYIGKVGLVIYDIQGRQIHNSYFNKNGYIVNKELNLLGIPNGVYIVKTIFGEEGTFNEKLVKH